VLHIWVVGLAAVPVGLLGTSVAAGLTAEFAAVWVDRFEAGARFYVNSCKQNTSTRVCLHD